MAGENLTVGQHGLAAGSKPRSFHEASALRWRRDDLTETDATQTLAWSRVQQECASSSARVSGDTVHRWIRAGDLARDRASPALAIRIARRRQDHLAISLAIAAALGGRWVGARTTARSPISSRPGGRAGRGRLQARLKVLTHPALLVVDDIGYLPISRTGAGLPFSS